MERRYSPTEGKNRIRGSQFIVVSHQPSAVRKAVRKAVSRQLSGKPSAVSKKAEG
jgi:hypothetical protein